LRRSRISLFLALSALAFAGAAAAAPPAEEPFFPNAGNPGYDAFKYEVAIEYKGPKQPVVGYVAVRLRATQELRKVSLDFRGPRVFSVVGPSPGSYRQRHGKLVFLPEEPIEEGTFFPIEVRYSGRPPSITDPDGTREGWVRTDDGVIAVGEPQGTAAWIPSNNVPWDKALFTTTVTVPRGLKAVANGRLGYASHTGGKSRFFWRESSPMSPYLAVLNIGRGRLVRGQIGRIPAWTLIDPRLERARGRMLRSLPEILRFQSRLFDGYPFESAGSLLDYAPEVGYALETQSRPIYTYAPSRTLVVHEVAHQWFGDSVGLERWPEIWLNEGFATWTQWYYAERHRGRSARQVFERLRQVPASAERFWNPPPGHPGSPRHLFDPTVYVRGAMAVQALRQEIGTKPLLRVLRRWVSEHRHGNATIAEFIALAEEVSGQELDRFFQRWLYQRGKPR
jgi:aminopeptidase N